jgi:hypothetical protein
MQRFQGRVASTGKMPRGHTLKSHSADRAMHKI